MGSPKFSAFLFFCVALIFQAEANDRLITPIYSATPFENTSPNYSVPVSRHFPSDYTLADVADENGNVLLFRVINEAYQQNFRGGRFVATEFNTFSYSLSPLIASEWGSTVDDHLLIALQNIGTDGLFYNDSWVINRGISVPPGRSIPAIGRIHIEPSIDEITIVHTYPDLTLEFLIAKLGGYSEVKVPVEKENVVAIVVANEFRELIKRFNDNRFSQAALLQALLQLPSTQVTNSGQSIFCQALLTNNSPQNP